MAQACLASPPLGGAGRLLPAVGRRGGAGAAVGSRARCDGRPGATRRGAAPSEKAEIQRRIRVSCGAAREPGKAGDDEDPSTSEPSMAPPTPTPVFSRRPLSARQRKILNERVLSRPPPAWEEQTTGRPDPACRCRRPGSRPSCSRGSRSSSPASPRSASVTSPRSSSGAKPRRSPRAETKIRRHRGVAAAAARLGTTSEAARWRSSETSMR